MLILSIIVTIVLLAAVLLPFPFSHNGLLGWLRRWEEARRRAK